MNHLRHAFLIAILLWAQADLLAHQADLPAHPADEPCEVCLQATPIDNLVAAGSATPAARNADLPQPAPRPDACPRRHGATALARAPPPHAILT